MPSEGVTATKVTLFDAPEKVSSFFASSESFWSARNMKIQYWRQLVKQIDYQQRQRGKSKKYHTFEGNESSSFYAAMVQLLTKHPLKNRIPLAQDNAADRAVVGQVERLLEGTYRDIDYRRSRRMETDSLHQGLTKFVLSDGWGALETVQLQKSNAAVVDVRLYDITDVAPEWSSDGLLAVVLRSFRTKTQLALEYPTVEVENFKTKPGVGFDAAPGEQKNIPVYSVYWRERQDNGKYKVYYGCAISNVWAIEPYELKWTEDVPVAVSPVNGLPFRTNLAFSNSITPTQDQQGDTPIEYDTDDWTADVGRGIFYMNETLYREFNDLWANVLDFIDKEGHDTWFKHTEGGDDTELTIGRGADAVNPMGIEDKATKAPPGTLAQELNLALNAMGSMLQRGGISWQLMGQLPGQEFSGFAINQLMSAALTIATPYLNGLASIYRQLDQFIVQAYRTATKSYVDVNVWREKTFVQERIDLSVLKNRTFWFEPEIRPGLPNDLAQRLVMAGNAKTNRLLDQWTIADEILEMDDPDLIVARLDEEEIMARPTIKLRRMIMAMLKEGNREAALALLMELRLVESNLNVQQLGLETQMQQFEQALNPPPNAGAGTSMETGRGGMGPGGGAPPPAPIRSMSGGGGVPPEVSPPELNGVSPAAMRAKLAAGNLL